MTKSFVRGVVVALAAALSVPAMAERGTPLPCGSDFALISPGTSPQLTFVGSATSVGPVVRLTPAVSGQAGAVWYSAGRIAHAGGFDTSFTFQLSDTSDGIALVLSNTPGVIGSGGSGLGYEGLPNAVAIEIDTFSFTDEFPADHVSVQVGGGNPLDPADTASLGWAPLLVDVNNGVPHTLRVVYVQGVLAVYFDGQPQPILSVALDLTNVNGSSILDGNSCFYVGLTGATGGATADQDIIAWWLTNTADLPAPGCGARFDYSAGFTGPGPFVFVGSSDYLSFSNELLLTPNEEGQAGSVFYKLARASVAQGFDTVFSFRLDGTADGIAFVLQSESTSPLGDGGSGLGYADNGVSGGIQRSVAIEIDTFSFPGEFAEDHVSVQSRGEMPNSSADSDSLANAVLPIDVNDGQPHTLRVRYEAGVMEIFFDGAATPIISLPIDFSNVNGNGSVLDSDGCLFVGFTGGTGIATANQVITGWRFGPILDCLEPNITFFEAPNVLAAPGPLVMRVEATGSGPLSYQWFLNNEPLFDDANISGTTTNQLTIDPVNTNLTGDYIVSVNGPCGGGNGVGTFVQIVPACPGDANGDFIVNFGDITTVLANFGNGYGFGTGPGDADANGSTSFGDITTVLANFGSSCLTR
jgi:hypothetical protein